MTSHGSKVGLSQAINVAVVMGMQRTSFDITCMNTKHENAEVWLTQTDSDPSRSFVVLFHSKSNYEIYLAFNVADERVLQTPAHPGLHQNAR
jgi:hypothetical protein